MNSRIIPAQFEEFIRGVADGLGSTINTAGDEWSAHVERRQMSDSKRVEIESGGYASGKAEGRLLRVIRSGCVQVL